MRVLVCVDQRFDLHDTGRWHPESPARLEAVRVGLSTPSLAEHLVPFEPVLALPTDVARVHPVPFLDDLAAFVGAGGGNIDADTVAGPRSLESALLAAGAGLEAVRRLDAGEADAAFCAVRPPGHHATARRAMGFCLLNNIAIVAASLAERGERVLIVDYDAHHGNGTQDIFFDDPRVTYVSFHQYPHYPGTGAIDDVGLGAGRGSTVNIPLPRGASGSVYRRGIDEIVRPLAASFEPTWLLVSAGFDAHRADPLTDLGLTAGDFADITRELLGLVAPGRRVLFLEGGYDVDALAASVAAAVSAAAGIVHHPEAPTGSGPGESVIDAVRHLRTEAGWR